MLVALGSAEGKACWSPDGGVSVSVVVCHCFLFVCLLVLQKFDCNTWFCFGYRCLSHVLTHENEYFRFWMNQGNSIFLF